MTSISDSRFSRRDLIRHGLAGGAAVTLSGASMLEAFGADAPPLITKPIPSSGEKIPVIGLGTNAYSVTAPDELAERQAVLKRMPELGGALIDTAPSYGQSEVVLGELIKALGNRDKLFIATKVTSKRNEAAEGRAMLEESLRRLQVKRLDLVQVHNLTGVDALIPVLQEWKKAGTIRYYGITTSSDDQYPQMLAAMRKHPLDFIQVDYSIANRGAGDAILPLAQEKKIGVLTNLPFGGRRGGNLFAKLGDRKLPDWAEEIDIHAWPQFLLKYVVSHPVVTCAIPGTTKVKHLEDNQQAARGRLPDATARKRMEAYWDSL